MVTQPIITLPTDVTELDVRDLPDGARVFINLEVDDSDGQMLEVTLSAPGEMTLFQVSGVTQVAGLTFTTGDGVDDNLMTFRGSAEDINRALTRLTYVPPEGDDVDNEISVTLNGSLSTIPLSSVNGDNGFSITGIDFDDELGWSASSAGDVNGDGYDDIVVGAPFADLAGSGGTGEAYVIFGSEEPFEANFDPSGLDGSNGFTINGTFSLGNIGFSVSSAGDVNGDGYDDVVVGGRSGRERYVIFGSDEPFPANFDATDLDGTAGFVISNSDLANAVFGGTVSNAGDINGDGFDDLILGSQNATSTNGGLAGQSYIVFGSDDPFVDGVDIASLDGSNGFIINGAFVGDRSGVSVSSAGDVNGDGIDDIIIGASQANVDGNLDAGQSYVVFGSTDPFNASFELSALDGSNGFTINGINTNDDSGVSVSNAGDVNGDGIDDLVIGAFGFSSSGEAYVVFGRNDGFDANLDLSSLDGTNGFTIDRDERNGGMVSSAGDINGDGYDDLIIGSPNTNIPTGPDASGTSAGESYVVFGSADPFPAIIDLASLATGDGSMGFVISGVLDLGGNSGFSVSSAGDVNGDGYDDLIVGAPGISLVGLDRTGQSYIIFGGALLTNTTVSQTILIDDLPTVTGDFLISGGPVATTALTTADVTAVDVDTDDDGLIYTVTNVFNGTVQMAGVVIETFTQADLDNGLISFVQEGGIIGSFDLVLTDGSGASLPAVTILAVEGSVVRYEGTIGDDEIIAAGADLEGVFGYEGDDALFGQAEADILFGGSGDDHLSGGAGDDTLIGGDGDDTIGGGGDGDTIAGGVGNDFLNGGSGDDELQGGVGNDYLHGGRDGDDLLDGGLGSDTLLGGAGDDTLRGGSDDDVLAGGAGADSFEFNSAAGNDVIVDWEGGLDELVFCTDSGVGADGDLTIEQEGLDVLITFTEGTVRLLETDLTEVVSADFVFL